MSTTEFAQLSAPRSASVRTRRRLPATLLVGALVLAALAGRWGVDGWRNRSPYPASAVGAHVSVSIVTAGHAQTRLDQLAGAGRLSAPFLVEGSAAQVVVGQLTFRTPHPARQGGQYALIVLDQLDSDLPVTMMWGIGPVGTHVGQGWDSRYRNAADNHRWLRSLVSTRQPNSGGLSDDGSADGFADDTAMAVMFPATTRGPVTFTAKLGPTAGSDDPARRITVALVFVNDSGHVYWADRLLG